MTIFGGDACGEFFDGEAFWEFGGEDKPIAVYLPLNFKAGFEVDFSFNAERDGEADGACAIALNSGGREDSIEIVLEVVHNGVSQNISIV